MTHSVKRSTVPLLASTALVLAACGSDGSADPDTPDVGEVLPDVEVALAAALVNTGAAEAFHVDMAIGFEMDMGFEGMSFDADLSRPTIQYDVDAEGEAYMLFDVGAMMGQMADSMGDAGDLGGVDLDSARMEYWIDGDLMTIDMSSFGAAMGAAGDLSQMGAPFDQMFAGPFTIDAGQLAVADGFSAAQDLTGQSLPNPREIAAALAESLGDDVEVVDGDNSRYRGTISFLEMGAVFGDDEPFGPAGDAFDGLVDDPAAAAAAFEDVFGDLTADVEVTIDGDAVDVIRIDADLSPIFSNFGELAEATGQPMAEEELAMMEVFFADVTFGYSLAMDFDLDPSIDVEIPAGDFPDFTDQFEQLVELGLAG